MTHFLLSWGYVAIFVLTVAEAACIPIPSELTLGLGGALATGQVPGSHGHTLGLGWVIVVGVTGELVGSSIAYTVGRTGGRALVDRFGKYVLLSHRDLDRAEVWFARRGPSAVLVGRVVPVVRTFISFPAGVAEMAIFPFAVFTIIGVTVWVGVLAGIGYSLGKSYHSMVHAFGDASYVFAVLAVLGIALALRHRLKAVRAERAEASALSSGTPGPSAGAS